jgi:four helix bundle protein
MEKRIIERVEDMPVFQACFALSLSMGKDSRAFAVDFKWLRGHMLRSSEAVCANMTEGSQYSTEYLQALYRCRREGRETMTHVRYSMAIKQLSDEKGRALTEGYDIALTQLANLIASIDRKILQRGKTKAARQSNCLTYRPLPIDHLPSTMNLVATLQSKLDHLPNQPGSICSGTSRANCSTSEGRSPV